MENVDYASKPLNWVRRQDREVTDQAWIQAMLQQAPYGMLGTSWEGQPFLKPTLFAFDETAHAIYFHSALEGRMRTNIEANPQTCFCVCEMGRLLPADTAMNFGVEYASVVVYGRVIILTDGEIARRGLQLLLDKYFPHLRPERDYQPIIEQELNITSVYRLQIEQWSGKKDEAAPDFPGAFLYGAHGMA